MRGKRVRVPQRRRRWPGGLALVMLLTLAACGGHPPTATPAPTRTPAAATPTPVSSAGLKAMIHGLVDRDGPPPSGYLGAVTNFVVDAPWSELQPTSGGPLAAGNVIDQAIAVADSLNSAAGGPRVELKIRLMAGVDAPAWAQQLGGGPVTLVNPEDGTTGTVGRFWTDAFAQAYDQLWSELATAYDNVPVVHEITVARCMTFTDEPFLRDTGDPANVQSLLAAGFSLSADEQCQQQEIQIGSDWHHTRIGVAFNPYQAVQADGSATTDEAFTASMMEYCRSQLGPQCVLENNSIRTPPLSGAYAQMYASMELLGPPITFQTATEEKIGNLQSTLEWAATIGADAVELPAQYVDQPVASLEPAAGELQDNPVS
ncbi:MAG: hypothetical protein WB802_12410 [Candidatus Dormiibacterota bacterium]